MRKSLGWLLVLLLCSAAGGETAVVPLDARLLEARADLDNANKAREKGDPASSSQVAAASDKLALLYMHGGRYADAEKLFQEALAIYQSPLDENPLEAASVRQHLADLYRTQGLYAQAEPLYLSALDIRKKALGEDHPQVATTLNHLAELYEKQGLYAQAEFSYLRALYMRKAALGENHTQFAASLKGLASIYRRRGSNATAEVMLRRVQSIRETAFGPEHPSVATVLELLAHLYWKRGDHEQAEPLYERTLAIRKKAFGEAHVSVALTFNNLARLHWSQGEPARAERRYQLALAIREKALGENHPAVATTLNDLAQLLLSQKRLSEAMPLLTRAFAISEKRLREESLGFSESRLAEFLHRLHASEQVLYSLARAYPEDAQVRHLALSSVLLLKGRSVEELTRIYRTLNTRLDPKDLGLLEDLHRSRVQWADCSNARNCRTSTQGPGPTLLAEEGQQLEAELAQRSAEPRTRTQLPGPEEIVGRVAQSLPRDSALIEFIVYGDKPLEPPLQTPLTRSFSKPRYLALVLFPDASTGAVDLGPADIIDAAVLELREALSKHNAPAQEQAQKLHDLVWRRLRPVLGSTRRIWLSPDGQLGLVPFHALHDGQGFLLDSYEFTYLTSGKQLLSSSRETTPASSVVVLAVPNLGTHSALLNVKQEAEEIQRLLPRSQLFQDAQVTRELLFKLSSPGILHIATHGGFIGENTSTGPPSRTVVQQLSVQGSFPPKSEQEPLLNSGIFVADPPALPPGASALPVKTTFVTALELAGLKLGGTQLVVLSSCESGLGLIQLGQGIYGLRRALEIAGAETLVMSLWTANDSSTAELMKHYYGNLMKGQGRSFALREAMRTVRTQYKDTYKNPYYWAPFFVQGSDAPLRGIRSEPSSAP